VAWRATIREAEGGRYVVRFSDEEPEAYLGAPDLQAAITEAQARWPELDFRPLRGDEDAGPEILAVSS